MADDVSILQEIDEALRADKLTQFWKENSGTILTFCVVVVLSTAVTAVWKNHRREVHERLSGDLAQAAMLVDAKKYDEAVGAFERVEQEGGTLATLAALRHAQALVEMKQEDKAIMVYNDVAAGKIGDASPALHDYAALEADILAHNQALATGKPPAPTQGEKEATASGRPFAGSFTEIDALRTPGDANAKKFLEGVVGDSDAPFSQRARAAELFESAQEPAK